METLDAEKRFRTGQVIMAQGEEGDCAYFIQDGRVAIHVTTANGERLDMGTRGEGSLIGEMAIVDNQPRSATIVAMEDCTLLRISKEDFARGVQAANPIVTLISQVILARYRDVLSRSEALGEYGPVGLLEEQEREYAMQSRIADAIRMANEFKQAIAAGQLRLEYQPMLDLKSGTVVGMEALMRWQHPERGRISPAEFIPMAEDSGLIVEATRWAMREACSAMARVDAALPEIGPQLFVSINISAPDFEDEHFFERFHEILQEMQTDPTRIHLEIIERVLIRQLSDVRLILDRFREIGTSIAIDDFGTGYSSLSYLHRYPIDILKVDQSFIRDMTDDETSMRLVRSILTLGENMGMKIIAEGVETAAQAEILRDLDCDLAQGFHFARPMGEAALIEYLQIGLDD